MLFGLYAVSISKAAILGIALGALVILLMILAAAFRPHKPAPFFDGSIEKPGYFHIGLPVIVAVVAAFIVGSFCFSISRGSEGL